MAAPKIWRFHCLSQQGWARHQSTDTHTQRDTLTQRHKSTDTHTQRDTLTQRHKSTDTHTQRDTLTQRHKLHRVLAVLPVQLAILVYLKTNQKNH